jgi:copper chaperone
MKHITMKVEGMSCEHCVKAIESALKEIGAEGNVHLEQGTVDVSYDESKTTLDTIKEVIEDQGYDVK